MDKYIETVKQMIADGQVAQDVAEKYFPELKESEDEKWIPKEIAKYLKEKGGFRSCWIAWLKKQKNVYTKQQLLDMGFAFTTNGDIVTPKESDEHLKEYLEYKKKQWGKENHIEQKPAEWSEEDEKNRKDVIGLLEGWMSTFKETCYAQDCKRGILWLKSLRPQKQWKPTEEQMNQLEWIAIQNKDNMIGKELMTLYNDLKKL